MHSEGPVKFQACSWWRLLYLKKKSLLYRCMLENEPSLFIICDPFKVFADQFKVFKIVFYTGWSYLFLSVFICCVKTAVIQSELYGRVSLHHTSVSCPCFSARSPLMTQTPCDENNLCLLVLYIFKNNLKAYL